MTAEEVIDLIDPTFAFENALERIATPDSYYLYEISRAGFSDHLQIWIFDNLDQFKAFLPALYFRNLVMEFGDIEVDDNDYQSLYDEYQNLLAVGKLSQPLPVSPTTDTTILINLDR